MLLVVSGRWLTDRQTSCLSQSVWTSGGPLWSFVGPCGSHQGFFSSHCSQLTLCCDQLSLVGITHLTGEQFVFSIVLTAGKLGTIIVTGYDCTKMYLRSTISVIIPQDPAYWSLNRGNRVSKRPGIIFWLQPKQGQPVFSCGNGNASTMRHWFRNSLCDSVIAWWRLRLRKISA